ncbi:hypothetical protein CEXT_634041 [Caerostris extrusa]|uniref:Secreted protein n=1 Tax=Caerostris extrusa TaxID=172846 RepID=A0AAV4TSS6_CAEEX|nr:hypothetical protein CEXT_634041 [Caerostris extrusa]
MSMLTFCNTLWQKLRISTLWLMSLTSSKTRSLVKSPQSAGCLQAQPLTAVTKRHGATRKRKRQESRDAVRGRVQDGPAHEKKHLES